MSNEEKGQTLCICQECHYEEWVSDDEIFEAYSDEYINEAGEISLICSQCGGEMIIEEE